MAMKARLLSAGSVDAVCFDGDDVISASTFTEEREGHIETFFSGKVSRFQGGSETVLHRSDSHGFTAVAALADRTLAVGGSRAYPSGIELLSPEGRVLRELDGGLGLGRVDWLGCGGDPERLFATTTTTCTERESLSVAAFDTGTWERELIPLRGSSHPALSQYGLARVTPPRILAEYAWKRPSKKLTPPLDYGSEVVRVPGGFFVYRMFGKCRFLDVNGKELWSEHQQDIFPRLDKWESVGPACAAGGNRIAFVTANRVCLIDGPSGRMLATCAHDPAVVSFSSANNLAWDGARLVTGSVWGVELIEDLPTG
jgi:hypothetical protein